MISRNVKRFRREIVFKANRLLYHSTLGSRVIKKKKKYRRVREVQDDETARPVEALAMRHLGRVTRVTLTRGCVPAVALNLPMPFAFNLAFEFRI